MPVEIRMPAEVTDVTQEQYELYITEVKAILFQLPQRQTLITPESLSAVTNTEIVSIVQASGGILVQLRTVPSPLDQALSEYNNLTETQKFQFREALGLMPL